MDNPLKRIKDISVHYIKERILLCRYYHLSKDNTYDAVIAVFDNRRKGMGLADRLKGIVSLYAYCKANNYKFKCDFNYPFYLHSFLQPNQYDWTLSEKERSESIRNSRILILHGETSGRLLSAKPRKQLHVYINRDYLDDINKKYHRNFTWGELFNELFKPAAGLQTRLDLHLQQTGASFIACQLRFMSLLGDFKEYDQTPLAEQEQKRLIEQCTEAILEIRQQTTGKIMVVSDSLTFINHISTFEQIITFPEKTVHVDCAQDDDDQDVYMKPFIDFLLLSRAEKVYSIVAPGMYPSEFPLYASKINNLPFERIVVE